jgi:hypothetical protein
MFVEHSEKDIRAGCEDVQNCDRMGGPFGCLRVLQRDMYDQIRLGNAHVCSALRFRFLEQSHLNDACLEQKTESVNLFIEIFVQHKGNAV